MVLIIRSETNSLEGNIGEQLSEIGIGNDFMDVTQKAQVAKAKMDKWDYIKPKSFATAKEKYQLSAQVIHGREKIFVNHAIDKRLIFKMYKKLLQFNSEKETSNLKIG